MPAHPSYAAATQPVDPRIPGAEDIRRSYSGSVDCCRQAVRPVTLFETLPVPHAMSCLLPGPHGTSGRGSDGTSCVLKIFIRRNVSRTSAER